MTSFVSESEDQTFEFARRLAESLGAGVNILLFGDLGAGKTTFAKGLSAGFGLDAVDEVHSPTFAIVNRYQGSFPIYHIDLYRIGPNELYDLGLDEILEDAVAVAVIEWADRLADFTPADGIHIYLSYVDHHTRKIEVTDE